MSSTTSTINSTLWKDSIEIKRNKNKTTTVLFYYQYDAPCPGSVLEYVFYHNNQRKCKKDRHVDGDIFLHISCTYSQIAEGKKEKKYTHRFQYRGL